MQTDAPLITLLSAIWDGFVYAPLVSSEELNNNASWQLDTTRATSSSIVTHRGRKHAGYLCLFAALSMSWATKGRGWQPLGDKARHDAPIKLTPKCDAVGADFVSVSRRHWLNSILRYLCPTLQNTKSNALLRLDSDTVWNKHTGWAIDVINVEMKIKKKNIKQRKKWRK